MYQKTLRHLKIRIQVKVLKAAKTTLKILKLQIKIKKIYLPILFTAAEL
jgi:hypothetical protein